MSVVDVPGLGEVEFPDGTPKAAMEMSIKQALLKRQAQKSQQLQANPATVMEQELASPSPNMGQAEFTKERQRSAIETPGFQRAKGAVIPTLTTAATMIPGMGLPAQSVISAGGTAINQLAGNEPYSLYEIGKSAAFPVLGSAAVGAVKGGVKALGKFVNPGATRTAGVEAAVESTGAVPNAVDRAYSSKASRSAYELAEQQPPLPVDDLVGSLKQVASETGNAIPNRPALKQLGATAANIKPPIKHVEVESANNIADYIANKQKAANEMLAQLAAQPTTVTYRNVMNEVQGLRAQAEMAYRKGNNVAGTTLNKAASALIDKMDEISPAIKEANALYRREQSTEKIAKVLSNPRPDVKLGKLLIQDPLVRGAFSKEEAQFMEKIAKEISTMGTQASPYSGLGARTLNLLATPLAAAMGSKTGMYLLRQTFKDGKITPQGLATVAQFMRAYQAQEGAQP